MKNGFLCIPARFITLASQYLNQAFVQTMFTNGIYKYDSIELKIESIEGDYSIVPDKPEQIAGYQAQHVFRKLFVIKKRPADAGL